MKGMELAKSYYEEYADQIRQRFPQYADRMAFGLVGEGSECYGYDDEISRDHDFGPGFCIWITRETARAIGSELQAAYDALPKQFRGFARVETAEGAGRVGVIPIDRFYARFTNCTDVPRTNLEWLRIPERFLSIATNGEVFSDPEGEFTRIRTQLLGFYPADVLRKKLAARAAVMSQSGQYNVPRCMNRGDSNAAYLATAEFVNAALGMLYLLERRYMPFYTWAFRGMQEFQACLQPARQLTQIIALGNGAETAGQRQTLIESICTSVAQQLQEQGFSNTQDPFLQSHLPDIMGGITDPQIRSLHVMADAE